MAKSLDLAKLTVENMVYFVNGRFRPETLLKNQLNFLSIVKVEFERVPIPTQSLKKSSHKTSSIPDTFQAQYPYEPAEA